MLTVLTVRTMLTVLTMLTMLTVLTARRRMPSASWRHRQRSCRARASICVYLNVCPPRRTVVVTAWLRRLGSQSDERLSAQAWRHSVFGATPDEEIPLRPLPVCWPFCGPACASSVTPSCPFQRPLNETRLLCHRKAAP